MRNELFTAKRWTDIPQATVTGCTEVTEDERKKYDKDMEKILRQRGVLKPDESLENC